VLVARAANPHNKATFVSGAPLGKPQYVNSVLIERTQFFLEGY
jgi:hypothetical protein